MHILDIAENSINAGASLIEIRIIEKREENFFSVEIEDNGKGIPEDVIAEVLDPFYTTRTTRKIGLGLALLSQSAKETGGDLTIDSRPNAGTRVIAVFRPSHIDMKPLGDLADTLIVLITGNPQTDFTFSFRKGKDEFFMDTREIKTELEGIPLGTPDIAFALREKIKYSLRDLMEEVE